MEPGLFRRLKVRNVDLGIVPVVPMRKRWVKVGYGGKVECRPQRAIVEADLVAIHKVVAWLTVQVGDVIVFVAVAELRELCATRARLDAIGRRAHALLGNVGIAGRPIGDAAAVLGGVVRVAIGVVVVLVQCAARVLDARFPLETGPVVILRAKRWRV